MLQMGLVWVGGHYCTGVWVGSTDSGGVERMLTDWHFGFGGLELENRRDLGTQGARD